MSEGNRVLFCAFAEVPGTSASGTRTQQWLSVLGNREVDALSLKGREAAHIQRLGGARMMRVPNTVGKPFLERLSTYQRALQRQLGGEPYDLVWCADLFSAATVAPILKSQGQGTHLIVEIPEVPSQLARQLGVEDDVAKKWRDAERVAIRSAAKVFLPSRHAAKLLSERIDARLVRVVPRAVDLTVFTPPSMELSLDDERLVLIFGGREGGGLMRAAVSIAQALAIALPSTVRLGILGIPNAADADVRAALGKLNLTERVELVDADGAHAIVGALSLAHVVVVPSVAEDNAEVYALPHRAFEAMACGRVVVVTGPEAAFKEAAANGEHLVVLPAHESGAVAEVVEALLEDSRRRDSLGRAAVRHMERTAELQARALDVAGVVAEATGVQLKAHAPRGDDPDTSSKSAPQEPAPPFARIPRSNPGETSVSGDRRSLVAGPSQSLGPGDTPTVTAVSASPPLQLSTASGPAKPAAPASVSFASGEGAAVTMPSPSAAPPAAQATPTKSGPSVASPSSPSGAAAALATMQPMPTVRMEVPPSMSGAHDGMWEGDTFLDQGAGIHPIAGLQTNPDAARVREAMLVSSDAQNKSASDGALLRAAAELSVPSAAPPTTPSHAPAAPISNPGGVPTSVMVQAELDSKPSGSTSDPWGPDTIADGTPIEHPEPPRMASELDANEPSASHSLARPAKKSLLVDPNDGRKRAVNDSSNDLIDLGDLDGTRPGAPRPSRATQPSEGEPPSDMTTEDRALTAESEESSE